MVHKLGELTWMSVVVVLVKSRRTIIFSKKKQKFFKIKLNMWKILFFRQNIWVEDLKAGV